MEEMLSSLKVIAANVEDHHDHVSDQAFQGQNHKKSERFCSNEDMIDVFPITELNNNESSAQRLELMKKIIGHYEEHLKERSTSQIGYPVNLDCDRYAILSPLLKYHINNIGDPFKESGLGLHSKMFEIGVLDWCAKLWEMEKNDYWGYVTSGGTEGNLYGILLGRELLPDGIIYTSTESHYSMLKIAKLYRMDCEAIPSLTSGEMNCDELRKMLLINKDRSAIVIVTLGTTFKGAVENVDIVIQTLQECGFSENRFYIHCDAALSGFIVPLLNQGPKYTFKKPIGSVSISGHKFLGCPTPCGVVLTRKKYIDLSKKIEYIDTIDSTISGSRNGHASMYLWCGLNTKGRSGLQQDVLKSLKNARYLARRLKSEGISAMLNENCATVVFERPQDREFVRHWHLQCLRGMAHAVVMPHVTIDMLDRFVEGFVRIRKNWYLQSGDEPPCLAHEIGIDNCACEIHK